MPWMRNSLKVLLGVGILLLPSLTNAATATSAYAMKIAISMPTGSEGEKPATTMPSNTKISPCVPGGKVNSVSFTITYNAGTVPDKDVFIILFNNHTNSFLAFQKATFPNSFVSTTTYATIPLLTAAARAGTPASIYLPRLNNTGGSITDSILNVVLTGVDNVAGTWQLIGIIADSTSVDFDFDDPTTWAAWDTGTFMIKKPWFGAANNDCQ